MTQEELDDPTARESQRLEVRARRTAHGDGSVVASFSVFCPERGSAMAAAQCLGCEDCEGMAIDARSGEGFIRCRSTHRVPPNTSRRDSVSTTVSEIMSKDVLCVAPDVSVEQLSAMLLERKVSGAPVVDSEGRPIGMVSKTDLLRERIERGETEQIERGDGWSEDRDGGLGNGFHVERLASATVAEIMTPFSFSVKETASVGHAVGLMAFEGVHRVPVVSATGQIVGILCAIDVVRWVARC